MEELKVGDRVQLIIMPWMESAIIHKDYIGVLKHKTSLGWEIEWEDGYFDPMPDYQDSELEKIG